MLKLVSERGGDFMLEGAQSGNGRDSAVSTWSSTLTKLGSSSFMLSCPCPYVIVSQHAQFSIVSPTTPLYTFVSPLTTFSSFLTLHEEKYTHRDRQLYRSP